MSNTTAGSDLSFNHWANMNGGKFPIHCTHRTGEIVDATFPALIGKNAASAQQIIDILNSPQGNRIQRVETTFPPNGSFARTVANAAVLADGRDPSDVIGNIGGHPTHMHVTLVPGGGTAGNANFAAAVGEDGIAWSPRGPRGEAPRSAAASTASTTPEAGPLAVVVAPNPVSSGPLRFQVSTLGNEAVHAVVYDLVGREVAEVRLAARPEAWVPASVDLGDIAPGVYVLRVRSGAEVVTATFVVVR